MVLGVEDVRLLEGDLRTWQRYGGEVEKGMREAERLPFGKPPPAGSAFLATREDVELMIEEQVDCLIDVRSRAEFEARTSGYDYISAKGRLPTARWGGEAVASAFHRIEGLPEKWVPFRGRSDLPLTFYCGTGWRSSLACFYAHVFGFEKARNYDGSWLEWSWPSETKS